MADIPFFLFFFCFFSFLFLVGVGEGEGVEGSSMADIPYMFCG